MKLRPVDSSSVAAIGYESRSARLLIQFRDSGELYAYSGVPPRVFAELKMAPSKGRFVNYEIKGRYPYKRLPQPTTAGTRRSPDRRRMN